MVTRQRVWIDRQVQGVLVGRVLLYWSVIVVYFCVSAGFYQWQQYPEWTVSEHVQEMFAQLWPSFPSVLLLPLVIFDIVRLSNRFAGPIYRLRLHLARLRADSNTYPLNFRDDDYWQQLAEPINELQQKILMLEKQVRALTAFQEEPATAVAEQLPEAARQPRKAEGTPPLASLPINADPFVKASV